MLFKDRTRKTDVDVENSAVSSSLDENGISATPLNGQPSFIDTATSFAVSDVVKAPLVPTTSSHSAKMPVALSRNTEPALRTPVIVPGTGVKSTGTLRAPQGRRSVVHAGVAVMLIFIVAAVLAAVVPTGNGQAFGLNSFFRSSTGMVTSKTNQTALIASQAATATAVTQDGYDPGNMTFVGVQQNTVAVQNTQAQSSAAANVTANFDSVNRFFVGQCTYGANIDYHNLTGWWVTWLGNADEWATGAAANGWIVSPEPNPNGPSIVVLGPGVQGAGGYGHVAVVEYGVSAASAANGISSKNMNWNGNWDIYSYWTFYPGPGVQFVWHP